MPMFGYKSEEYKEEVDPNGINQHSDGAKRLVGASVEERLLFHMQVNHKTGCWEWLGGKTLGGYPVITIEGKAQAGHREMYKIKTGSIPDGMWICHRCDNPSCINPDHLFLGTPTDNVQDMLTKGRGGYTGNKGEDHPKSICTEDEVIAMRELYTEGFSIADISIASGKKWATVSDIVKRRRWKHV